MQRQSQNQCVHDKEYGKEVQDINRAVMAEYDTGCRDLLSQYTSLFRPDMNMILSHDLASKQ